jgi:hypothetical protein
MEPGGRNQWQRSQKGGAEYGSSRREPLPWGATGCRDPKMVGLHLTTRTRWFAPSGRRSIHHSAPRNAAHRAFNGACVADAQFQPSNALGRRAVGIDEILVAVVRRLEWCEAPEVRAGMGETGELVGERLARRRERERELGAGATGVRSLDPRTSGCAVTRRLGSSLRVGGR